MLRKPAHFIFHLSTLQKPAPALLKYKADTCYLSTIQELCRPTFYCIFVLFFTFFLLTYLFREHYILAVQSQSNGLLNFAKLLVMLHIFNKLISVRQTIQIKPGGNTVLAKANSVFLVSGCGHCGVRN